MTYSNETMGHVDTALRSLARFKGGNPMSDGWTGEPNDSDTAESLIGAVMPLDVEVIHDHTARCCREHGTHSVPHMGCILR